MRSLLTVLLTASALVGAAPAQAAAPPVVGARAGIGSSHFGGGHVTPGRPRGGFRRRGFGHGFFFFGGGLGFLPLLIILLLLFLVLRQRR